jgi:hypothetical protein
METNHSEEETMKKKNAIPGTGDVCMETVKRQSLNRQNLVKSPKYDSIHSDKRYTANKESALPKKIKLQNHVNFFPEGYEKIFLGIYLLILPYLTGILFLFFYVAGGHIDLFTSLYDKQNFLLNWCIGYEILAVITLFYIMISATLSTFKMGASAIPGKTFRRP